jgi:hypothetical protein
MRLIWLFHFILFSLAVRGQQTGRIETDRPDQTECPFIVKKGYIQAELGFNRNSYADGLEYFYPTTLLKMGLWKNLELRHVSIASSAEGNSSFKTEAVGFKLALIEGSKWIPRTAIITHFHWDNLNRDESERNQIKHSLGDAVLTMQNDFGKGFGIGYNLGAEFHTNGTMEGIYRIAPNMNIGRNGYAYVEIFGRVPFSVNVDHWVDGGLAYYLNDHVKLDISLGKSLSNKSDWYGALGISFRFKVFNP